MSMPDPGSSLHLASIDYACTFGTLTEGGLVSFSAPDPVHFTFSFETGQTQVSPGVYEISTDYSWFVQEQVEVGIAEALSSICQAISDLLSLPLPQVNAVAAVQRVWTFKPNIQGQGVSSGAIVTTDFMTYPPQVTGADTVSAVDAGAVSASSP
jgi:hypothetical protein